MPNKTRGVGLFTAENIVAVIRAIPESDGTYRDIARKAQQYGGNVLVAEHCGPDNNRNREMDRALEILKRTCECGNDKVLMPDGKLSSTCQDCQDLDTRQRRQLPPQGGSRQSAAALAPASDRPAAD